MIAEVPTYGLRRGEMLCLSGSGYRAALFHLGALTRLNELGLLAQVETVAGVAGGSLLAALLASRVDWPLQGAFREWPEAVAEPMRSIARRNARARALLRAPISAASAGGALEERYARELVAKAEPPTGGRPRLVFGGAGLSLGEISSGSERAPGEVRWEIDEAAVPGYDAMLVASLIATVRTDLDAFGEAEQAVLENHGYLLADAAVRSERPAGLKAIEPLPPEPPHPRWMNELRVREALAASSRRTRLGRLRPRHPARQIDAWPAPSAARTLLERHRPVIQYDSLESFRADSVGSIVGLAMGRRCNSLHRADGSLIAAALPPAESTVAMLDLDFLGAGPYANGLPVHTDDYLDESGGAYADDALAMRRRKDCADVAYGRACCDAEGRTWLQYWLFYYYNDKGFLKVGLHEGDWEMVQLQLGEEGTPEAATYAQHSAGVRAEWKELERRAGGEAPVVYCARGSHASLLRAGTQAAPVVPDHNDGLGAAVRPRLVVIGEDGPGWAAWPGRWGSTRRREAFEGHSPRGPAQQPQWSDPAGFHREARPSDEAPLWEVGPVTAPALRAHLEGECAIVSYRFGREGPVGSRPERIVAAPYAAESSEPPRTQAFSIEGEEGSIALQLPPHSDYEGVRLSVASEMGAPGETLAARFVD